MNTLIQTKIFSPHLRPSSGHSTSGPGECFGDASGEEHQGQPDEVRLPRARHHGQRHRQEPVELRTQSRRVEQNCRQGK